MSETRMTDEELGDANYDAMYNGDRAAIGRLIAEARRARAKEVELEKLLDHRAVKTDALLEHNCKLMNEVAAEKARAERAEAALLTQHAELNAARVENLKLSGIAAERDQLRAKVERFRTKMHAMLRTLEEGMGRPVGNPDMYYIPVGKFCEAFRGAYAEVRAALAEEGK